MRIRFPKKIDMRYGLVLVAIVVVMISFIICNKQENAKRNKKRNVQ